MEEKYINSTWNLNRFCNFTCPYCFVPMDRRRNNAFLGNADIESIVKSFNNSKIRSVHMSGGEPFLHPRFIDLCLGFTEKHTISINTNLSSPFVYEFTQKLNCKKVSGLLCSVHITELEKFNIKQDFIKKYKYLEEKGFNVAATMVVWPPLIKRLKKIYDYFGEYKISLRLMSFRGGYNGKTYPESYAEKDLEEMESIIGKELENFETFKRELSFTGMPCRAGFSHCVINENGDVFRCYGDSKILGNINRNDLVFSKTPEPCPSKTCPCPPEGINFVIKPRIETLKAKITHLLFLNKNIP